MTVAFRCELAVVGGEVRRDVAVSVDGGRITSIGDGATAPAESVLLPGLVLPGFANAHSHAFHRALRGRTQSGSGSFWTWRDAMFDVAGRLDPVSYHRLARATFAEMVLAGFTAVGEFHYLHHAADGTPYADPNALGEALLAAATEAGIRITLLDTVYLHGGLDGDGYAPVAGPQTRFCDHSTERWFERVEALRPGPDQLVGAAVHSVRAVDPASIAAVAAWARERAAPLHVHVSEQTGENDQCLAAHGCTPTVLLHEHGALGPSTTLVHATHLTTADIERIATTGAGVCICPTTERDLGDGIGPSAELAEAGVPLSLGTDSHAAIDPFEEARSIEFHQRLRAQRRGAHPADSLLHMASVDGHRSLGREDVGAIAVGYRADLVAVALASVRTAGTTDDVTLAAAVFAATAADVTHVVADGSLVVADRQHRSLDVAAELHASITALVTP